jgi:membrane-bound lytic murein transglycosylase B
MALGASPALGQAPAEETTPPPASQTQAPAPAPTIAPPPPVEQGATIAAPPVEPQDDGGVEAKTPKPKPEDEAEPAEDGGTVLPLPPTSGFTLPYVPSSSCSAAAVPAILIPIYQRAAAAYGLGPQGPAVLAAINEIETAFGTNLNISSAGAMGWMQFMPETWEGYGVDANGDGVRDPFNPEDAIFAAAGYLSASGFPEDTYGAIYAYNHADWYVADVLAGAACFGSLNGVGGAFALTPKLQVLRCQPAKPWRKGLPTEYLNAFEDAAGRYGLGRDGVWALAAVARLESNFGRGMSKEQLEQSGPLGLDGTEWTRYAVDGDGNGRIQRADPDDSAATLARLIWSRGGLRAGLFSHNQASWYVQAVLADAERMRGRCKANEIDWPLSLPQAVMAPIEWENLTLSNDLERQDLASGAIDPRIVGLIGAITQEHTIVISSLRSDHSMYTVSGGVSNHYYGRAMDIAMVDGISCTDTAPTSPCGELAATLSQLPAPAMPTELIYCYDVDGPGPAFARADHCDHVHAGYDG